MARLWPGQIGQWGQWFMLTKFSDGSRLCTC
jgi:hypothetical protein